MKTLIPNLSAQKPSTVLKKARKLLSERSAWTHGYLARDRYGSPVNPHHESAISWCCFGAIDKCRGEHVRLNEIERIFRLAAKARDGIVEFNDNPNRTHEQIIVAFDKAIKLAEAEEKDGKV
jgi:hypothetical protein